jgi:hypothetical protein
LLHKSDLHHDLCSCANVTQKKDMTWSLCFKIKDHTLDFMTDVMLCKKHYLYTAFDRNIWTGTKFNNYMKSSNKNNMSLITSQFCIVLPSSFE